MSNNCRRGFLGVLLSVWMVTGLLAQPKDNSPWSRIGLGNPVNQQFANAIGMGSLSAAWQDPFHVNVENPASLAFLEQTAFEVGIYGKYATLTDPSDSNTDVLSGNLQYLSLGFPLQNSLNRALERDNRPTRWGMNISLLPYTSVGYDVSIVQTDTPVDTVVNVFNGEGGTYRLMWGNGVSYKNFSAGVNLGIFFGKISRTTESYLTDVEYSYDSFLDNEFSVSGVLWNAGVQYRHEFKSSENGKQTPNSKSLTFGFYGNSTNSYKTNASQFYRTRNFTLFDIDTIRYTENDIQKGTMPSEWTIGLMYQEQNKLKIGLEYGQSNWSKYVNLAQPETLYNAYDFAAGLEFIPDSKSYNRYFKRVRYRLGFRHFTDPRSADGALKGNTVSVGFGLPIILPRQQVSFANFAIEYGTFGENDNLSEQFVRLTAGFTLNDNSWFFKRRFN